MNTSLAIYLAYFFISLGITVWVARTLHSNGRIFLVDAFGGNKQMADSVNHLLVVGFYLINLGFILLFLRIGEKPHDLVKGIEYISTKLGVVMLVLGGMHFFNMFNFSKMRKKALTRNPPPFPIQYEKKLA
jgi:cytochrome c biogenesis protein CcdA